MTSFAHPAPTTPPNALEHWDEITRRLAGRKVAVFLDYDGTLTPIVRDPDQALLTDTMREAVRLLAQCAPTAIISGRDRADVQSKVGLPELHYAGSHGFDIVGPEGSSLSVQRGEEFLPSLDRAEAHLKPLLTDLDGAWVERKRYAIAVHFRNTPVESHPDVERAVDETVAQFEDLRKTGGKMIFELRPAIPWHKGKAVEFLLEQLGLSGPDLLPLYLGDDETDEDAFQAIAQRGLGILVGEPTPHGSAAHYLLRDTEEAQSFLNLLQRELSRGGRG